MAEIAVDLIESVDELATVAEAWRELAKHIGNAFITPEWYLAALRWLHPGARPAVVVARSGGRVWGVLPLLRVDPIGAPGQLSLPGSQFCDIFQPASETEREDELAAVAAPFLADRLGRRSQVDLGRVPADARWPAKLAGAWPGQMALVRQPREVLPEISLADLTWESYLATRSRQFRNQLRRKLRSLEREHDVHFRRSRHEEELRADLQAFFDLHEARWRDRPQATAIADPAGREFLREVAVGMHRQGWLRLHLLEIDGAPVAAWYGWSIGGRYSYYQAGFDPAMSRHSLGFLLLAQTVRTAIEEGATTYDLLLGDEGFKVRFATGERRGARMLLAPSLSLARVAAVGRGEARSAFRSIPEPAQERLRGLRRGLGDRLANR